MDLRRFVDVFGVHFVALNIVYAPDAKICGPCGGKKAGRRLLVVLPFAYRF